MDISNKEKSEYRISTKWPTQIIGAVEEDEIKFGEHLELRMVTEKTLININPGLGQIEEEDGFGFSFCKKCGHLSHGDLQSEHDRPYAIPSSDLNYCGIPNNTEEGMSARNLFSDLRTSKCKPDPEDQQIIDSGTCTEGFYWVEFS